MTVKERFLPMVEMTGVVYFEEVLEKFYASGCYPLLLTDQKKQKSPDCTH